MTGPLLAIDAATARGTVAIVEGRSILGATEIAMRGTDEERLMPAVASTLRAAGLALVDLGGVVCGAGPGSFTSLRIAASIGKALALGAALPLFSVSSLALIVAGEPGARPGRYLAVLDAMRDDVFSARIEVAPDGLISLEGSSELVPEPEAESIAVREGRTMVGPRCERAWQPHARGVASLAEMPAALSRADLASWEPAYGRLAEAQVQWERAHGRRLTA